MPLAPPGNAAEADRRLSLHLEALYERDRQTGRITQKNQWDGGRAPVFHMCRSRSGAHVRFRDDLPEEVASILAGCSAKEPKPTDLGVAPKYQSTYLRHAKTHGAVGHIWSGPVYAFPHRPVEPSPAAVLITAENAALLADQMADWLPDVPYRRPLVAIVEQGRAVAVCASVRITASAHEAGVETVETHRRRGHATAVVRAWARHVLDAGATPIYSTSWDNVASQNVASGLGLELIGSDFHVE